jgi:CRISPR-associated protein (TIGR03986 family)
MITAPFNFVPLSDKVFFPDWAEDVSHDIPFEDAQSGSIDITITAKSPIFIRNHSSDKENSSSEFCNYNGEYYIPATSVKGMVRNVLEIMSFSKMNQFDDDTYAVRDLSSARNFYMTQMQQPIFCGWLQKKQDGYVIEDCGTPARIRHEEIDKAFQIDFASKFKKEGFLKTSEYKYQLLDGTNKKIKVGERYKSATNPKYDKRLFCKYDPQGEEGTLVVTGQPTPRKDTGKKGDGKGFEFVFFQAKKELTVKKEVMENFLFAYFDKRTTEPKESPDWTFWKKKLEGGEKVPVFFQKENGQVAHFGLSYLYKLPYKHSIKDGLTELHFDKRLDLAQTIFGYTDKKYALKGRVQFSHFKAENNAQVLQKRTEILGTPRASYYPIYIKQQDGNLFTTYMDDFSIAGWKRYPIHQGNKTTKTEDTGNTKVGTTFAPLNSGVIFKGKLRYHNLKRVELGAILSALTFHNTKECYHNIGMAKSLGYGKIDIKLNGIEKLQEYLKAFESEMTLTVEKWAQSEQIKELFSMATEQNNTENSQLKYMKVTEFAASKSNKDYLRIYTKLNNIKTVVPSSFISQEDLDALEQKQIQREKDNRLRLEKEKELAVFQEELQVVEKSDNIQVLENFIKKYTDYENIEKIITQKELLQKTQELNKHQKVNDEAKKAWDGIHDPKYAKNLQKSLASFIKKWEKKNKGSEFVLELVEKAKAELK